ncbi:MAG TPA: universal stress protein [Vicinamibacteria bacterium]
MNPTRIDLKRILCPVDFSDYSHRALERAVPLANWFDAEVVALHVVPFLMPPGPGLPHLPAPFEVTKEQHAQAERDLKALVAPFLTERAIETRVRQGTVWREILAEAEELPADLVVMGTHGRSGFQHLLLGSVTEKFVRRATCPVLTVGNLPAPPRVGPLFRRILCAADLTEASAHTIDFALSLAEENRAAVTLIHVIDNLPDQDSALGLHLAAPDIGLLRRELVEYATGRLRRAVPDASRDVCRIRERVEVGTAWREILRAAKETEADLIVMGAHVHGPVGRRFFGSTSSQVVRQASCPVLVARETEAPGLPVRAAATVQHGEAGSH